MSCPSADVLAAFAAGELVHGEAGMIASHLGECPECLAIAAALGASEPAPEPGAFVGRYQILAQAGRGAFGVVYAAYDPELDRRVALKLLHERRADDEDRSLREARAMAKLSSPHVVAVHDVGRVGDQLFIAMEFFDGQTLAAWLRGQARTASEIIDVFVLAGRGLVAAHAAGIIHRDFKPENVLVHADGRVAVTDFGLARGVTTDPVAPGAIDVTRTIDGALVGTPLYMSPEALRRQPVDARSDVFSFCVALHEGLFGVPPFSAESVGDLLAAIERGPRIPRELRVPRHVREAVLAGLAIDPARRPQTMAHLLRTLEHDPRRRRAAVAVVAVAAASLGVVAVARSYGESADLSCKTRARSLVDHVWGPQQRAAVDAGFAASGSPLAADAVDRVERVFDAYASAWRGGWSEACVAGEQHAEADNLLARRLECLERRRERWSSLVATLEHPDAMMVVNAATAIYALPDVDVCSDERWLAEAPAPEADARLAAAHAEIAKAQVLADLGQTDAGLATIAAPLSLAHESRDRALEAEARLVEGDLRRAVDPRGAEEPLHAAAIAASAAGRLDLEAAAKVLLVQTLAHSQLRLADVARAADYAAAIVMRLHEPALLADYMYARSLAEWSIGGAERSLPFDIATLAIQLAAHGDEHPRVAEAENNIAASMVELELVDASLPLARHALEMRRRLQGAEHPETLNAQGNLAFALAELGRIAEALPLQEQVAEGRARVLGANYFLLDETYVRLARLYQWELGRSDDALRVIRRARELDDKEFGPDAPEGLSSLTHLARILVDRGERDEADRTSEHALAIATRALPPSHLVRRSALAVRGYVLERLGRCTEALPLLEQLDEAGRSMVSGKGDLVLGLAARARCLVQRGDPVAAERLLLRAVAIREATRGHDSPMVADALIELAAFYRTVHRRSDAIAAAQRAIAVREHTPGAVLDGARAELARAQSSPD